MKKIPFGLIALLSFSFAQAQIPVKSTKTITAADTLKFSNVPSKVVAFQYSYTESNGTTAGKVYLEGSVDNVGWVALDSLTLADVATTQTKVTTVTATAYLNYRFRNTNTSSATGVIYATYLRRPDDR